MQSAAGDVGSVTGPVKAAQAWVEAVQLGRYDAAWAMIDLLQNQRKLSRLDAYGLASMVMDCRLAAPTGEQKAVHCLVPKSTWVASR